MDIFIGDCVCSVRGKARPDGGLAEQTPYGLVGALIDAVEQRGAIRRSDVDRLTLAVSFDTGKRQRLDQVFEQDLFDDVQRGRGLFD